MNKDERELADFVIDVIEIAAYILEIKRAIEIAVAETRVPDYGAVGRVGPRDLDSIHGHQGRIRPRDQNTACGPPQVLGGQGPDCRKARKRPATSGGLWARIARLFKRLAGAIKSAFKSIQDRR